MDLIIIIQGFEFLLIKQCNQNILTVHKNLKAPSRSNNGRWGRLKKQKTTKGQLVIDVKVDALPVFCRLSHEQIINQP